MNRISLIFVGTAGLICLIIGFFITRPAITSGWQTYKQIQTAKSDLNAAAKKKDVLTTLSKNNQLSGLYDIAAKYIPDNADSSGLVIALSAIASDSKMKSDQLSFDSAPAPAASADTGSSTTPAATSSGTTSTPAQSSSVKTATFSMTISGAFPDFMHFLKSSESSSRLITFSKMSFSQSDTAFQAQLSGTAYYKPAVSLPVTLDNIQISADTIKKFQNLKSYGTPINLPTESGFGRADPFTKP